MSSKLNWLNSKISVEMVINICFLAKSLKNIVYLYRPSDYSQNSCIYSKLIKVYVEKIELKFAFLSICTGCNMAVSMTPSYSCSDNTLEVRWPTDIVYTEDVKEIPARTRDMLTKAAQNAGREKAQILTLNRNPE